MIASIITCSFSSSVSHILWNILHRFEVKANTVVNVLLFFYQHFLHHRVLYQVIQKVSSVFNFYSRIAAYVNSIMHVHYAGSLASMGRHFQIVHLSAAVCWEFKIFNTIEHPAICKILWDIRFNNARNNKTSKNHI